jgi:hypothetical protein
VTAASNAWLTAALTSLLGVFVVMVLFLSGRRALTVWRAP